MEWVSPNQNCQISFIYRICGPWSTRTTSSTIILGLLESSPNVPDAALTDLRLCGHITLSSAILDHLTCSSTLYFSQMHPNTYHTHHKAKSHQEFHCQSHFHVLKLSPESACEHVNSDCHTLENVEQKSVMRVNAKHA